MVLEKNVLKDNSFLDFIIYQAIQMDDVAKT